MKFQQWVAKRSHLGREVVEERIQNLTDQWWQARLDQDYDLADHIKDELNIKYNAVVMEGKDPKRDEVEKLLEQWREARRQGKMEEANRIHRLLSSEYDIAIFT